MHDTEYMNIQIFADTCLCTGLISRS